MAIPTYGAAPLAKTFFMSRALQLVCFIGIISITASFISDIVSSNHVAPTEIIATIAVVSRSILRSRRPISTKTNTDQTSIAALYCLLTIPFFWSDANKGLLVMTGIDFLLLLAFVIIAVVLGKPLTTLNCPLIASDLTHLPQISDAFDFTQSLSSNVNKYSNFISWSGATKGNCLASKAAWGLCIALCLLFFTTTMVLPALFAKKKRADGSSKV